MPCRICITFAILIVSAFFSVERDTLAFPGFQRSSNVLSAELRRPAAMCWIVRGKIIAVANSASGTVSLINVDTGAITESKLGEQLTAITWVEKLQQLAIVDQTANLLMFASMDRGQLAVENRIEVGRGAKQVAVSAGQNHIAVTSLWDGKVSIVSLSDQPRFKQEYSLDFEPGEIVFTPDDSHLIVFDAFGGRYAVIHMARQKIVSTGDIAGHQIRDVKFTSSLQLVVALQIMHQDAATTPDNIAAGAVIENVIQDINVKTNASGQLALVPQLIKELGVPSNGAADPSAIAIDQSGNRYIALGGVNEVMVTNEYGVVRDRISVGHRPLDLLLDDPAGKLYCLNTFSQTISVIDIGQQFVVRVISLGPLPKSTAQSRGEELFFDANRSRFGWYSCQSCHVDGHTNGQLADTFGDGTAGAPKRVLSLLGGRDNNPWAWNGSMRSLHDQVLKSGVMTMQGEGFTAKEANDLVAYLHTLEPPPPFRPPTDDLDRQRISAGATVFDQQGCSSCHIPPLTYTSDTIYDVGLTDEHGTKKFNPPSLIGVGYRRVYFHDGRARKLRDVFAEFGHQLDSDLSEDELASLIRFLESL